MILIKDMVWTCHVCGDERRDHQINVRSTLRKINGVRMTENVRYCNDRESCIERSKTITFLPKED